MAMQWYTNPKRADVVGLLPEFLSEHDPRSAVEQLDANYAHGGGWRPFSGFTLTGDSTANFALCYPEDPPLRLVAWTAFRGQLVGLFQGSWVAVIEPDGAFVVSRMD